MNNPLAPDTFDFLFAAIPIAVGVIFVLIVVVVVVRVVGLRRKGLNPLTLETDLAAKVMNSEMLAPERPIAERLAEIDTLLAAGAISEAEHAAARARILGSA